MDLDLDVDLDLELQPELDPAALELVPAEPVLTGCGDPATCGKTCVLTIWLTIAHAAQGC